MDDIDSGQTFTDLKAGIRIQGRYKLVRLLGRGGMGIVWLATDSKLEREVALKFLPASLACDPKAMDDLKRETKRALELTHTHIVRIYDIVDDPNHAAISMEFIDGASLSKLSLERPDRIFSVDELVPWVRQLGEALTYAHSEGKVVHRDLKPANLLIDKSGRLKVTDFGISANISDSASRLSRESGSSGTPAYMSPEQLMGEKPDPLDDVYSFGATLYELLTGKPPFHSGRREAQVLCKVPPSIALRRSEFELTGGPVPENWEATIATCLAKTRKERPPSIGAAMAGLGLRDGRWPVGVEGERAERRPVENQAGPIDQEAKVRAPVRSVRPAQARTALKAALVGGAIATVGALASLCWYFGIHQPEQRRIAEAALQEAAARKVATEQAERERIANLRGGIIVRTNPSGAVLMVGALEKGMSPMTLKEVPLGRYAVIARLEDYEDWNGEVEVKENRFAELEVDLVRSQGLLQVKTVPQEVAWKVIGKQIAEEGRGEQDLKLPTGEYEVTFSRPNWPDQRARVVIARNQTTLSTGDLAGGILSLESVPVGANWELRDANGAQLAYGKTPAARQELPEGRYTVVFRRSGWPEQFRVFDLKKNNPVELMAEFPSARLAVNTEPRGTEVWIDGNLVGRTPLALAEIPANQELRISLNAEGYRQWSQKLKLAADREAQVGPPALIAEFATLNLRLQPEEILAKGAAPKVTINGDELVIKETQSSRHGEAKVAPGRHVVQVEHPDFYSWEQTLSVMDGEERSVSVVLQPRPAIVVIRSEPAILTEILVNGVRQVPDASGNYVVEVPAFVQSPVSIKARGFAEVSRTFLLDANRRESWNPKLDALKRGRIRVRYNKTGERVTMSLVTLALSPLLAQAAVAGDTSFRQRIYLNGKRVGVVGALIGDGSWTSEPLVEGEYYLQIANPGDTREPKAYSDRDKIVVRPGETYEVVLSP